MRTVRCLYWEINIMRVRLVQCCWHRNCYCDDWVVWVSAFVSCPSEPLYTVCSSRFSSSFIVFAPSFHKWNEYLILHGLISGTKDFLVRLSAALTQPVIPEQDSRDSSRAFERYSHGPFRLHWVVIHGILTVFLHGILTVIGCELCVINSPHASAYHLSTNSLSNSDSANHHCR